MKETPQAQKEQILSDWRDRFSPDELRLLVVQLDSLVELARQEVATETLLNSNPSIRLIHIGATTKKLAWATDYLQWEVWSLDERYRHPVWHYRGEDFSEALNELTRERSVK